MSFHSEDMTDLDQPVTRRELREELEAAFARNLEVFSTKDDLKGFPTKDDPKGFAMKDHLKEFATKDDLFRVRDELRTHFTLFAESFKSDFAKLYDWAEANAAGLAARVEDIETGHSRRLLALETRVTRIENAKAGTS